MIIIAREHGSRQKGMAAESLHLIHKDKAERERERGNLNGVGFQNLKVCPSNLLQQGHTS